MKINSRSVVMFVVLLVLGFLLSFSFQRVKNEENRGLIEEQQWNEQYNYKKIFTDLQKTNDELRQELKEKQLQVKQIESELAKNENELKQKVENVKKFRKILGKVPIKGEGISITIDDAKKKKKNNEEDFIVHDGQVQLLLNELYVSGAEAISINGQIITRFSSIVCVGPIITVDNINHSTPFVISAIGNKNTLYKGIKLPGGIYESLKEGNLQIKVEKKSKIIMKPIIHEKTK